MPEHFKFSVIAVILVGSVTFYVFAFCHEMDSCRSRFAARGHPRRRFGSIEWLAFDFSDPSSGTRVVQSPTALRSAATTLPNYLHTSTSMARQIAPLSPGRRDLPWP